MTGVDRMSMKVERTVPLLIVSEIAESRAFYCEGLGFEQAERWEADGRLAWCWLRHGGAALMLQQACADDPPPSTWGSGITFYFICEDAEIVYHELKARGIEATQPTVAFYGMNQTFVTDPDGYKLCFENPTQQK